MVGKVHANVLRSVNKITHVYRKVYNNGNRPQKFGKMQPGGLDSFCQSVKCSKWLHPSFGLVRCLSAQLEIAV